MELNATVLIQAVIILVLMAWLSPVLFGPLLKVFDERDRRIHGAAARLDEARAELFAATESARTSLKSESAAIADDIVKKVLGRAA